MEPTGKGDARMTDATDCQLLRRFVRHRDEAAFAVLAGRHAPRVLGVCRRVLRDEHDAEEVAQATFLVLARKAVALPWRQSVGPWLSAVAHRLALNARTRRIRGRAPCPLPADADFEPCARDADPAAEAAARDLGGLVRAELARLPEKYRAPVVLCYLEGKTNEQAAHELGWPAGSMSRRLEKARRLLREMLTGRGLALLVGLFCLAAALVAPRTPPQLRRASPVVVEAMSGFKPAKDRPGAERLLLLAQRPSAEFDREALLALAAEAARVADSVAGHDPGHRRDEW